ncbi:hypothetical protein HYH02_007850 [Chlamydomonas schloesseri]|uniref:Uncharacterized protein n=1 Tax=Chlamydomonas schloesseri TaxID=2026947 RepID=A0A835WGQ2_9CHLO|nr:hypothetical protein HYH02_007850 [Chlamydomonas schloesseri]|eukprot:KAG2447101.1 hypothetical protein HYH02_007850 [Chlamydomonas schloesseri]
MSSFPGFVSVALERLESCLRVTPGLTGYCLITSNGQVCSPAKGPLLEDLQAAEADPTRVTSTAAAAAPPPAVVSQFLRPFNTLQPTVSFAALGTKLQVVHQAEGAVFALGPRRRVGLGVCLVPQGVVVLTFDRSLSLPAAVGAVERCAAGIRAACAAARLGGAGAAMSVLAQRQWRQRAQTAVRVAVTATKEARSTYQALSDGGDGAMSDLSNALLQLAHLPSLPLPQPLAALRPDVRAAAAAKLARQQEALAAALTARVSQMAACVEGLGRAVEALDQVPQDEPWMRASPVFHTFPLPRVRQLLAGVYDMYRLEQDSKAATAAAITALMVGPAAAAAADVAEAAEAAAAAAAAAGSGVEAALETWRLAGGGAAGAPRADARGLAALAAVSAAGKGPGGGAGGGGAGGVAGGGGGGGGVAGGGRLDATRLSELCTTYVSVWLLAPYLEEQAAEEALGALTEDMASF